MRNISKPPHGIFWPLVKGQSKEREQLVEPSDRLITPANAMTVSRPVLAAWAGQRLLSGESLVTPIVAGMALTDMEGSVARFFDKHRPEWKIGTTKFGTEADQIADTLALLIVSGAALKAPKVSLPGKLAIATVLGSEGTKAVWAINRQFHYANLTRNDKDPNGMKLSIPTLVEGKEAMAEKFAAIVLAVSTHDIDRPDIKHAAEVAALGFAAIGAWRGEWTRQQYETTYQQHVDEITATPTVLNIA